ncbi:MAG: hypothetical protein K6G72_05875 [Lachnospiraceae bacterium]|nr:hypothetical protein [Lachnospiraceae bacterium]
MEKTSKIITYIFLAACVAIPFLISLISRVIADASADKNGHGIDGIGAALATGMFIKVLQIVGYAACLALWIYSIVRVFKSGMPKWVIIIPAIPIAAALLLNMVRTIKINKAGEAYTPEVYIREVTEKKSNYTFTTAEGDTAIYVYGYLRSEVVDDLWLQKYKYNMDMPARKAIADQAIPALMKDLESEALCYKKARAQDGTTDGNYFKTTMEYWNYEPDTDTLTVKFSHKNESDVFENKWADAPQ